MEQLDGFKAVELVRESKQLLAATVAPTRGVQLRWNVSARCDAGGVGPGLTGSWTHEHYL